MTDQETCPDCGAPWTVRRLGTSDWGPPIHHQQGGLECVKRQNEQLWAALQNLICAAALVYGSSYPPRRVDVGLLQEAAEKAHEIRTAQPQPQENQP